MKNNFNLQKNSKNKFVKNSKGFLAADFIFSFVLVLSCGIIIFALTFSLATIEISQYIVWSSARAYSAANINKAASEAAGKSKFNKLSAAYPLLTGNGESSPWFELSDINIGDAASIKLSGVDKSNKSGASGESRHPWTGATAMLRLKLFESIKIPFLGKIATDAEVFKFPIHAFLLRNPSQAECIKFYQDRFNQGIQKLENNWPGIQGGGYVPIEDNGC